jgi:hypothetical protein
VAETVQNLGVNHWTVPFLSVLVPAMTRTFIAQTEVTATIPSPTPKARSVPVHPQVPDGLMRESGYCSCRYPCRIAVASAVGANGF